MARDCDRCDRAKKEGWQNPFTTMPQIMKQNIGGEEVNAVNARELHARLQSKQDFSTWIKARIEKYGFVEGVDYLFHKFMENHEKGGRPAIEYFITIDMAKELSMVENNEAGKIARRYFIECEKLDKTRGLKNGLRDMPKREFPFRELNEAKPNVGHTDTSEPVTGDELFFDRPVDYVLVDEPEPEQTTSNELAVFNFENHTVRTVIENGEAWFVAKDVALALGYVRPNDAINDHCDGTSIYRPIQDSMNRTQKVRIIDESDVYALIFGSKLESSKRFKKWVTSEVLPTIRKTGSYTAPNVETKSELEAIDWTELVVLDEFTKAIMWITQRKAKRRQFYCHLLPFVVGVFFQLRQNCDIFYFGHKKKA